LNSMLSKRFALIVGGAIGGIGAVVSITPPQFGSSGGLAAGSLSGASLSGTSLSGSSSSAAATTAPVATPAAVPTATNTPASTTTTTTKKKTKKKKAATSTTNSAASTTSANATAQSATPTPVATTAAPKAASGVSGTFTGAPADTRFGPVQVQITISNGKITNVTAPQYPTESFRDQQINAQAIPYLIQETLQAQSANIQGVGGASYTSEGFYQSLVSALSKAGM
jgi:uncharacterized protein with FMN-binding domain